MNRLLNHPNILLHIIETLNNNGRTKNAGRFCMTRKEMNKLGNESLYIQVPRIQHKLKVTTEKVRRKKAERTGKQWALHPETQPEYYRNNKVFNINRNCNCSITKEAYKKQMNKMKKEAEEKKKQKKKETERRRKSRYSPPHYK